MAVNYPASVDDTTTLPNPAPTSTTTSPSHAGLHDNENAAIIALETKLGTGSSTPSSTNLLVSTGAGTSSWSKLAPTGTIVGTTDTQTLTNKTLTAPVIATIVNTGTLTLPTSTDTLVGKATTDIFSNKTIDTAAPNTIKINGNTLAATAGTATVTIPNSTDTLVGRATTDTLLNKTLTAPVISSIVNTGTLTLPTSTDTLVGRATTDTLSNKTIDTAATNTLKINGNTLSATAGTATVTVPNSTDTLVGKATTDTLTNKTITSTTNSISYQTFTSPYKFRAYLSAAQNTSANTGVKVTLQSKTFDTGNNYDNTTNYRFVAPIAGFYQFVYQTSTSGTTGSNRYFNSIYKNGVEIGRGTDVAVATTVNSSHGSDLIELAANDYVELYVYCDTTLAINIGSTTYLAGWLVSTT